MADGSTAEGPVAVTIEFARATETDDPFAFAEGKQDYVVRLEGASFRQVSMTWGSTILGVLQQVRLPDCDPAVVAQAGTILRRFLAGADWNEIETTIADAVSDGRTVILTIRSAAAELFALPFELLSVRATGQHLGEMPGVVLRYAWPETTTAPERPVPRLDDGRIVVAWSASGGGVPAGEHIRAITAAAELGGFEFDTTRDVLQHADLETLDRALGDPHAPPVSVLHLLAHGAQSGSVYGLTLDDGEGGRDFIDPRELRQILTPYAGHLRLVVLAACDSSNSGAAGNVLGSIAQSIHRAGIQSVIASRFPLSTAGSNVLTRRLYHELLVRPASVEDAVRAARADLLAHTERLDWAAVQLYARPEDGDVGVLVDATVGLGGHTAALLHAARPARVIVFDQDPQALERAAKRLADVPCPVEFVHAGFARIAAVLEARGIDQVAAIIADLGVSSMQLDQPERGFSFRADGPLDMRMDPLRGRTAAQLLAEIDVERLSRILREYGEEPHARRIAAAVVAARPRTTQALADAVLEALDGKARRIRGGKIHPATRTFMALRIEVNDEMGQLDRFLADAPERLTVGGRLAVITFHSLEDRRVKRRWRALSRPSSPPAHLPLTERELPRPRFGIPAGFAGGVTPGPDERHRNPRARSARLRVLERLTP